MVNQKINPEKVVQLGEYKLYFGNRAFRIYELETGQSVIQAFSSLDGITFTNMTNLVAAGLKQFHPLLTLDDIDLIIDEFGIDSTFAAINSAISKAMPKQEGEVEASNSDFPLAVKSDGESP